LIYLQREANKLCRYSAKRFYRLLRICISKTHFLSKNRCTISCRVFKRARKGVLRKLGKENLIPAVDKVGKKVFNNSKLTDHFALIPTDRY